MIGFQNKNVDSLKSTLILALLSVYSDNLYWFSHVSETDGKNPDYMSSLSSLLHCNWWYNHTRHPTIPPNGLHSLSLLELYVHCSLSGNMQFSQPLLPPIGGLLNHFSLEVFSVKCFPRLIQDWAKCFSYTTLCISQALII